MPEDVKKVKNVQETIFQKIMSGTVPCYRLYEDAHVFSFLDIEPLSLGHALVVPKERALTLDSLSDDAAAALGRALPRICRAVKNATHADSYNILQNNGAEAGQAIEHVHFHIIPKRGEEGLHLNWNPTPLSEDTGHVLAARIQRFLGQNET